MSTGEPPGGGGGATPAAPWPLEGFGQSVVLTEASEQRLQALRRALRRADRFALFVVLSPTAARGEVLRRLQVWSGQEGVPPLHFLPDGDQGAQAVEDLLETAEPSRVFRGVVIPDAGSLLDGKDGHVIQALNVARDTLAGIILGPLVLVLPAARAAELPRAAPDLFDIRSGTYELEANSRFLSADHDFQVFPSGSISGPSRPMSEMLEEADRLRALASSAEPPPEAALADAWLKLARELFDSYEPDDALAAAHAARDLAEGAGYQGGVAAALRLEGDVAMHLGDLDCADEKYRQALALYQSNQDRRGEASCLWRLNNVTKHRPMR